jgi:Domain of unknown function (DUF4262)
MTQRGRRSLLEIARDRSILLDQADSDWLAMIDDQGWSVTKVFDPSGDHPDSAFSVGLTYRFQQPEVLLIGLPLDLMQAMINIVGQAMEEGDRFIEGTVREDLLEGDYACRFVNVHPAWYEQYLGSTLWFNRLFLPERQLSILQCVWPNRNGTYPWDPTADASFRELQPVLRDPPESN